jgi:hypothetical protein
MFLTGSYTNTNYVENDTGRLETSCVSSMDDTTIPWLENLKSRRI